MSIAGIISSSLLNLSTPTIPSPQPSFQKEFQKLGKDLRAGNLSAAQADFATLQQNTPSSSATAAQQIQQAVPSQSAQAHHHHHFGGGGGWSGGQPSSLPQEFAQLSQSLQAGNLSAAQQAYSSVQQSLSLAGNTAATALSSTA